MALYLGLDGGGTKTRVLVGDERGRVLGRGVAGPSNFGSVGPGAARSNIREAISMAASELNQPFQVDSVFAGVAGVMTEQDQDDIVQALASLDSLKGKTIKVHHDIHIALAGGVVDEEGIALVSGTGSSCYGRNRNGDTWQVGGWGHVLGDEGSGYWLAIAGLGAAVRELDGRGPSTGLTSAAYEFLDTRSLPDLVRRTLRGEKGGQAMRKDQLAAFGKEVCRIAETGDRVAMRIVDEATEELAAMVRAVSAVLEMEKRHPKLILTGSVANNPLVEGRLRLLLPGVEFAEPRFDPVTGALLEAMRLGNENLDTESIANLSATHAFEML